MSELGNHLKQVREEKQISLDDLQTMTKIQKRYLIGIEEGNYQIMPGKFYVRAFIKQYAEAVGLDPEELFERYRKEIPDSGQDEVPGQLSRVQTQRELPESASKAIDLLPKIIIIILILAAAFVIYILNQSNTGSAPPVKSEPQSESIGSEVKVDDSIKNGDTDLAEQPQQEKQAKEPEEEPAEKPEPELKQSVTGKKTGNAASDYKVENAEKLELEITAKNAAWISVKNGKGKTFLSKTIQKGNTEKLDLTNENEVKIRIGNAPNTDIKINGEALQYAIDPSKVMTQSMTITYTTPEKSSQ